MPNEYKQKITNKIIEDFERTKEEKVLLTSLSKYDSDLIKEIIIRNSYKNLQNELPEKTHTSRRIKI